MRWIDRLIQKRAAGPSRRDSAPTEPELQALLDGLADSPDLLAGELRDRPDCPDDDAMCRFLSRRCDPEEKKRVLEHVLECPACLATVDDLTREARLDARTDTRSVRPATRPAVRRVPRAGWALGFATPLVAACVLLAVVFSRPALRMELEVTRSAVRSATTLSMEEGARLHEGDRFRVEVSALEDGYFFLYAWNETQGGKFIYPADGFSDDNRIRKGQSVFVPDGKGWLLEDATPGMETFFLLFSEQAVPSEDISRLDGRLGKSAADRSAVEDLLAQHFSVEQRFTYHVE